MYRLREAIISTNTSNTALLIKLVPQMSGSTCGYVGLNQLDRYMPIGTPVMPDATVTIPNSKEILKW